jgi:hypothetical protein
MVSPDDLHLKKVKLTSTRSACMIDFTSKEVVGRSQSSEGWFPFLRVI